MLRAASLPGQQLSRRVLSTPCLRLYLGGQSRWLYTSEHTHEQPFLPAPPPHLPLRNDAKARVQNPVAVSVGPASELSAEWELTERKPQPTQDISTLFKHLDLLHTTKEVTEAWTAYEVLAPYLSGVSRFDGEEAFVYLCLHRLILLLSSIGPRTQTVQRRIISVVESLAKIGGRVYGWERLLLRSCIQGTKIPASREIMNIIDNSGTQVFAPEDDDLQEGDEILVKESIPDDSHNPHAIILVPPLRCSSAGRSKRAECLNIIARTQSFSEAWEAFRSFPTLPTTNNIDLDQFPQKHLHRLVSLLATVKPRTRKMYLCLVSILSTMRGHGYRIQLWEWNLLMDCAAKGWRKMRPEDYKAALRVFNDMLNYQAEMRQVDELEPLEKLVEADAEHGVAVAGRDLIPIDDYTPDIYSYTTLIAHAARTLYPPTLQHARSLFHSSNLAPNRITLLSQMRFYTMRNQLFGVRHIVAEMRERGFILGNDGMNSLIWAFARNKHMDVAEAIYRLMRHNVLPEDSDPGPDGIAATARFLDESENIVVPATLVPDHVTYTILIQGYAYQGDLTRTLQIFMDMLQSPDPVAVWRGEAGDDARFVPIFPVYRAIFLGFYRHGVNPRRAQAQVGNGKTAWNSDNLFAIFKSFLELPMDQKPGDRVIYWLIMAFAKSTAYDAGVLRKVWKRLEQRFGDDWGKRLQKLRKSIYGNTEHAKAGYLEDVEDHEES